MSLVNVTLPLGAIKRIVEASERIADALERAFPPPTLGRIEEPTDGVSIVTNEVLLEEEVREELRSRGFMPDDIERMLEEDAKAEVTAQ